MKWIKENWFFVIIIFIFFALPFILPFLYKYPTKDEYENWKRNATPEEIQESIYEQRDSDGFYAP